ncbi:hypothetical protein DVB69_09725 [Sporosarcina sp. BI001-red]|uniref:hypothetical protein n=1 Tax=Sporosarcina sp. BI001-red TaxID=2282866 RepID=UPI000E229422|nr:hypothetical protein [Sporosarcina sp. BI001-red]REB07125.1 hypothetical protein DVB69_09725 [Sporosarcina sp. BI001-red]
MKNGKEHGWFYWTLSYHKKFVRSVWMIPIVLILIIILLNVPDLSLLFKATASWLLTATLALQLIYNYFRWKYET